ncbi:protein kinase domain-containing protein [Gemmata sp.]|uniref:protein kinase domain-containing protein n=1 Tax=Gemmata sp. TaxID=1914242 RepID=UPI003F72BE71
MDTTTANGVPGPDLPAFLHAVRESGCVPPERFEAWLAAARPVSVPDAVARLAADGLLTGYQARTILQGKGRRLTLMGKYRVLDELGTGGAGVVLLAEHIKMRKRVAIKILPPRRAADPATLARFRREATALAALDHPNVIRALDCDEDGGVHFLAMEYAAGGDFGALVRARGPLPVGQAVELIAQAAAGLDHAHREGWVHRDVKPANLLVTPTGVVKVLDLGLARLFAGDDDDGVTARHDPGAVMGTIDYIAPEQTLDSSGVDHRADVYALGATFYFLLTGRPPFPDGTPAQKLLTRQLRDPVPVRHARPDVSEEVAALIGRMMARDPADRYPSLADVVGALRAPAVAAVAAAGPPAVWSDLAADPDPSDAPAARPRPARAWWAAAAAALVAGASLAGWTATRGGRAAPPPVPAPDPVTDPVPRPGQDATFTRVGERVEVAVGGKPFATYLADPKYSMPFLADLRAPGGRVVSEALPEGSWPHTVKAPGVWGCLFGQSAVVRPGRNQLTRTAAVEWGASALTDTLTYAQGVRLEKVRANEKRTIDFSRRPHGVLVRWASTVTADPFSVVNTNEGNGFGIRLARTQRWEFRTAPGRGPGGHAPWIEAATTTDGRRWGAVLIPHPENPVGAVLTGKLDGSGAELRGLLRTRDAEAPGVPLTIAPDRPLTVRFGVFVFETPAAEPIDPAAVLRDYAAGG